MTPSSSRALMLAACLTALALVGCGQQAPSSAPLPSSATAAAPPASSPADPSATPSASASATPTPTPSAQPVNCSKLKCVALTFDDGPGPQTGTLLDTLVRAKVPATFFLVGNMVNVEQAMAKRIAQTPGMTVANHTISHPMLTRIGIAKATREITANTRLIEKVTGVKVRYFRPPYGLHNKATDAVAKRLGQAVVVWSAGALDWVYDTPAKVIEVTMPQMAPGAILLAHDIHAWTVKAVPTLIRKLRAKGFTLVSLDDILGKVVPGRTYARGKH